MRKDFEVEYGQVIVTAGIHDSAHETLDALLAKKAITVNLSENGESGLKRTAHGM